MRDESTYPRAEEVATSPYYWGAFVVVLAMTWAILAARQRQPWIAAVAAIYLVTLLPILGLLQAGDQEQADRFTYVSLAAHAVALAALLIPLILGTRRQISVWHDPEALWSRVIMSEPGSGKAHLARGEARLLEGRFAEASDDVEESIRIAGAKGYKGPGLERALDCRRFLAEIALSRARAKAGTRLAIGAGERPVERR